MDTVGETVVGCDFHVDYGRQYNRSLSDTGIVIRSNVSCSPYKCPLLVAAMGIKCEGGRIERTTRACSEGRYVSTVGCSGG